MAEGYPGPDMRDPVKTMSKRFFDTRQSKLFEGGFKNFLKSDESLLRGEEKIKDGG